MSSATTSSLSVYVGDLNSSWWSNWGGSNGAYTSVTFSCAGQTTSVGRGSVSGTSGTAYFYGLTANYSYYVSATVYYKTSSGDSQSTTLSGYFSTLANPQPAAPALYASGSIFTNTATITASGSATVNIYYNGMSIASGWQQVSTTYNLAGAGTYTFTATVYDGNASPDTSPASYATITIRNPYSPSLSISAQSQSTAGNNDPALVLSWSWSDSTFSSYFSRYNIYNGNTLVTSVYSINSTSYTISNLSYNSSASYKIEVVCTSGGYSVSAVCSPVTGTTVANPVAPTNVYGSQGTGTATINVSWGSIYTTGVSFKIQYKLHSVSTWTDSSVQTNSTRSATITGLTFGQTYDVRVLLTKTSSPNGDAHPVSNSYSNITIARNRPANFSWSTAKTSGGDFNVQAAEWNNFTSRINDFLEYKNKSKVTFTSAIVGGSFYATLYNQAANAIGQMNWDSLPTTYSSVGVSSGEKTVATDYPIYASELNGLVSALNGVS